jgi:hypothetical protein
MLTRPPPKFYGTRDILLSVSRNTARTRIRRVHGKLDVVGRDAAVRAAQDLGVLAILPRRNAIG